MNNSNRSGQNVLSVASTTGFSINDKIIRGNGTAREEFVVIQSISAGVSLTLTSNLALIV